MMQNRRSFLSLAATGAVAGLATPAIIAAGGAVAAPAMGANNTTGVIRRKIGAFEVTALLDGALLAGPAIIGNYDETRAAAELKRQHLPAAPQGQVIGVNGYLINTGDTLVAIDCGTNDSFSEHLGNYHTSLAMAGVNPAEIDMIIATHLHVDHIGGLSDADGAARFANASVVAHETEWNFWNNDDIRAQAGDGAQMFFDIARTQTAPYGDRMTMVKGGDEILPGIEIVDLPGHTPGHVGVHLRSEGAELMVWGDLMHTPKLQFEDPSLTIAFDIDPELAIKTRSQILNRAVDEDFMIAGMHMDFPGFGHVDRAGSAFRFHAAAWDFGI